MEALATVGARGRAVDMTRNGPSVPPYRRPSGGVVPYEEWRDDAACHGLDPNLFELQDPDEITDDDQQDLIAQGLKVCSSCPVRAACKSNSSELDRYWTTRGGQPPEGLFPDGEQPDYTLAPNGRNGGFASGRGPTRTLKAKCKRGHENWRVEDSGKRRCVDCAQINNRARYAKPE